MTDKAQPWLILPRDPVLVRDGRPFGPDPGARAESLPFPFPSTIAGAVRERHGEKRGGFGTNGVTPDVVRKLPVQGPFLVQFAVDGTTDADQLLLPAPHDSLLLQKPDAKTGYRCWLRPLTVGGDVRSDLDDSSDALWYVGPSKPEKTKPFAKAPTFWWWPVYRAWLEDPRDGAIDDAGLGIRGLTKDSRVHVRVDPESSTAVEGFLFQTSGVEFSRRTRGTTQSLPEWALADTVSLGLFVTTTAEMDEGLGSLGGERRTVFWKSAAAIDLPGCSEHIKESIRRDQSCRMILGTPGVFEGGWKPLLEWLAISHLQINVKGAVVSRYDVVSGWDYAVKKPKATRRLVPAGAVYYLSLAGSSAEAIDRFIQKVWLQPVSDAAQDRLDGFGIALLGTWNGKQQQLEVK